MPGKLTSEGIQRAAAVIGCDVPALRAVLQVEALGAGFLEDGRPKILFERHIFHRLTGGKFDAVLPRVSQASPGGYESPGGEWNRLYLAAQLDHEAAVESASWGIGQVMGFNWKLAGEKSLIGFLLAMHHDENSQLALMAQFIRQNGPMAEALRRHDWPGFAKLYNGSAFAKNAYDQKLASAYAAATAAT